MFQDYFGFSVVKQKHYQNHLSSRSKSSLKRTQLSNQKIKRSLSKSNSHQSNNFSNGKYINNNNNFYSKQRIRSSTNLKHQNHSSNNRNSLSLSSSQNFDNFDQQDYIKSSMMSQQKQQQNNNMNRSRRSSVSKKSNRSSFSNNNNNSNNKRSSTSKYNCFTIHNNNGKHTKRNSKNSRNSYHMDPSQDIMGRILNSQNKQNYYDNNYNNIQNNHQNYNPYQLYNQTRQYNHQKPVISHNFYREDRLIEINNYQFRMKQYYKYNDKGDYFDSRKQEKQQFQGKMKEKCHKMNIQSKNVSKSKQNSQKIELFQQSKLRTQSQYYINQKPVSQKQSNIKIQNNSSQNIPQMYISQANNNISKSFQPSSICKNSSQQQIKIINNLCLNQDSQKNSSNKNSRVLSNKNSKISSGNRQDYQLQMHTKIIPSSKYQTTNVHASNADQIIIQKLTPNIYVSQGVLHKQNNRRNNVSFQNQSFMNQKQKAKSLNQNNSNAQSKNSINSLKNYNANFPYEDQQSKESINKENILNENQGLVSKCFVDKNSLMMFSNINNNNNNAHINNSKVLQNRGQQFRKSIIKKRIDSQIKPFQTISEDKNQAFQKSSFEKRIQEDPVQIISSKNIIDNYYQNDINSNSQTNNVNELKVEPESRQKISQKSSNKQSSKTIIKDHGKLPCKSRFSLSQSIQQWNFINAQKRSKNKKKVQQDDLLQDIIQKIDLHLASLNIMAQFILMTQEIYQQQDQNSDWTKIPSFLIYKKFLQERTKVLDNLKGNFQQGSCFNIQDLQITPLMLKKYLKQPLIINKAKQIQIANKQIKQSIKQYYQNLMQQKQKYSNPLVNLQSFDDSMIGVLMIQLNAQFEALQPKVNQQQVQDINQIQIVIERLYKIMQLVFLLSQLQGRRVKRFEQQFDVNGFQEYYEQNYPTYRQTILFYN